MGQYYLLNPYDIPAKYSQRPMLERQNNFFPLVTAIATAIAPTIMAAGGAAAFLTSAAVYVGITALTSWAINSLVPKQRGKEGTLVNKKDPVAYGEIVYGTVRKGGPVTFMNTTGTKNRTMHMVVVLAGHEVESIGQIYINDEAVTLDSNGFVTSHGWKSKIQITKKTGAAGQTSPLPATYPDYAKFTGNGIAYLFVELKWDQDVFSNGIPVITAVVQGKKVPVASGASTSFSRNSARIILDYLRSDYGLNVPASEINVASFTSATSHCDAAIPKAGGGNTARYRTNGVLSMGDTHKNNLQKLLDACGGTLFWSNGQWHLKVAVLTASVTTFNEDDFREGIIVSTKNSRKDNFNRVVGTFNNEENRFLEESYPDYVSTAFTTLDGEESTFELNLPMVTDSAIAQRLAKIALFRSREEIVVESAFSLKAMDCQPGDVVRLNVARYGWSDKLFEVVNWGLDYSGDLKIRMTLKETSAAAYDWASDEKAILHNNTNLPSARGGLTISDITLSQVVQIQRDGTVRVMVEATWPEPESGFVSHYNFYYMGGATKRTETTVTTNSMIVGPLINNVTYTFGVRAVSASGTVGDWLTKTIAVTGDVTPPANPTSITAVGGFQQNVINWVNPTADDFSHNELYMSGTAGGAKTLLAKVSGTTYVHGDLPTSQTVWYFLKAVDRTGNVNSAFTSGVSATTKKILNEDLDPDSIDLEIADGSITIAKFATSIRPIEIVSTLPTTGNTVGRQAYLTTDGKTYRWTGSAWSASVSASDVSGTLSISNFATNIRPLEIVSSLPTTGNFNGRQVFLTTNGKNYRYTGGAWTATIPTSDLTGTITAAQIGALQINSSHIEADSIIAGKVAAGAISTRELAANAATISKLAVTDWENLIPNGDLSEEVMDTWTGATSGGSFVTLGSNFARTGSRALLLQKPSGNLAASVWAETLPAYDIPVTAGDKLYAETWIRSNSGGSTTAGAYFRIQWFKADKTTASPVYNDIASNAPITGTWTKYSGEVTVPSNAAFARIRLFNHSTQTTHANLIFDKLLLRRMKGGELIVDGAITTDKLAANAVTAGKIAADAVTAGKIQAGAVGADQIAARAISAGKLAITDNSNMFLDSELLDPSYWSFTGGASINSGTVTGETSTRKFLLPANNGVSTRASNKELITVNPGDSYLIVGDIRGSGSSPVKFTCQLTAWWYDKDKNYISINNKQVIRTGTSVSTESYSVTVPTNAQYMMVGFNRPSSTTDDTGGGYVMNPRLYKRYNGELIVDGAITASKINVTNLAAIESNLGAIDGGSIKINNRFIVDIDGTTTIRSATSGERMTLTNNRLDVHDASGVLRIRIGQL